MTTDAKAEAVGLEGIADVLADHVMSGEPECLSPSMVWIWRCVCSPAYARSGSVRSVALANHRTHVADQIRAHYAAALTSPAVVARAGKALHALWAHEDDGECLDPSGCGATVDDEREAATVLNVAAETIEAGR